MHLDNWDGIVVDVANAHLITAAGKPRGGVVESVTNFDG